LTTKIGSRLLARLRAYSAQKVAILSIVSVVASLTVVLIQNATAHADSGAQLALPSAIGNITMGGGPHNWAGCSISPSGVLGDDCLINHPWNSVDFSPADGQVHASHGGIAHIYDCPSVSGHRSFVRIDYNDGSGYQVSYEHIHNVDAQIVDGQSVARGQYLGNISTDSDCGATSTAPHAHMSLWNIPPGSSFTKANSQAVDLNGQQVGAWLLDDGSPTQEQYIGCITPVSVGTRLCPTTTINNDGSVGTQCTALTASATPTEPPIQSSGTPVTITGMATCPSSNPLFEFWAQWQGTTTWQLLQGNSTSNAYHWNSTGAASGTETFAVWARDSKSVGTPCNTFMGCYDRSFGLNYQVQVIPCTWASISASPGPPSSAGTTVIFTGVAGSCPYPRYEFWALWQGSSTWQLLQAYSPNNLYVWDSTGAPPGFEYFGVWVKDASSSTSSFDANASMQYQVT
jgi:hypothetical protein